jgi:hypothetical protein
MQYEDSIHDWCTLRVSAKLDILSRVAGRIVFVSVVGNAQMGKTKGSQRGIHALLT